jgi:FKBP-type peptidyl-prolyl cis-trans isomerase
MLRLPRASYAPLLVVALAMAPVACREITVPFEDPTATTFAPSLNINLGAAGWTRTSTGLYYRDISTGSGETADSGDTIRAYYKGWLTDGRSFESNRDTGQPYSFILGTGGVIKGWDEGIRGMRVNGRRQLVIPPALAYGASSQGNIPAGSVLIFEIDLVSATAPAATPATTSVADGR